MPFWQTKALGSKTTLINQSSFAPNMIIVSCLVESKIVHQTTSHSGSRTLYRVLKLFPVNLASFCMILIFHIFHQIKLQNVDLVFISSLNNFPNSGQSGFSSYTQFSTQFELIFKVIESCFWAPVFQCILTTLSYMYKRNRKFDDHQ